MKRLPAIILLACGLMAVAATADARQLTVCDAAIQRIPEGWSIDDSTACRTVLKKRFEHDGYWYAESMSIQAANDNYDHLQDVIDQLYKNYSFRLVDRERLSFATMSAPFWVMYKSGRNGEAIWLALVLHQGLTYSVEMRSSALDLAAVTEFGQVLVGFDFLPDERDAGWTALSEGDTALAERKFSALVRQDRADANALYGYGLALLAQGSAGGAAKAIEQARPQLGVTEDARRALGRAALERGQANRAVALWIQVIRDHPAQADELRPWILGAILKVPPQALPAGQADIKGLASDGGMLLYLLQAVDIRMMHGLDAVPLDEDSFNATRSDLSDRLSSALDAAIREPDQPADLRGLLAATDLELGGGLAAPLFSKWDDDIFFRAELVIARAMRDMSSGEDGAR